MVIFNLKIGFYGSAVKSFAIDSVNVSETMSGIIAIFRKVLMSAQDESYRTNISRNFVRIKEGQVHYRTYEPKQCLDRLPLIMLHASPSSSHSLIPLILRLGLRRRVIALDTLGNGDSAAPEMNSPDISYFAKAHLRAIEAIGIHQFDLYGSHTGGCIAAQIAIERPEQVRSLILDGMSLYSDDERSEMLAKYAPAIPIDQNGSHINWFWHFVRDTYMFWPWYKRDAHHARTVGLPAAGDLHDKFLEVLKAARTYHLSYNAAIAWSKVEHLPRVKTRTLLAYAKDDMLMKYMDGVKALMPNATTVVTPGLKGQQAADETSAVFERYIDQS